MLYFQTVAKPTHFLPSAHLHLENILTYCVSFNLVLKYSLLGLKLTFVKPAETQMNDLSQML